MIDRDLLDRGCTCHLGQPPCSFCTSLSEEEVEAYERGGIAAVEELHRRPAFETTDDDPDELTREGKKSGVEAKEESEAKPTVDTSTPINGCRLSLEDVLERMRLAAMDKKSGVFRVVVDFDADDQLAHCIVLRSGRFGVRYIADSTASFESLVCFFRAEEDCVITRDPDRVRAYILLHSIDENEALAKAC